MDKKISELTAFTTPIANDLFAIVDSALSITKKITFTNLLSAILPTGLILMWHGTIATIPAGWVLCDGNNSTPDLRDKFIVGAGSTYTPGDSVANPEHVHNATLYGSNWNVYLDGGEDIADAAGAGSWAYYSTTAGGGCSGTTYPNTGAALPPYYALAYIMKT